MTWTTKLMHTEDYTPNDVHMAWFVPKKWKGSGPAVNVGLPECEVYCCTPIEGVDVPLVVPLKGTDVKTTIEAACHAAQSHPHGKAALMLICDTAEQVDDWAKEAFAQLKGYRRMPVERFYKPEDRADRDN